MNRERFRKVLSRFLKEKKVYNFILGEINKEHKGICGFIDDIERIGNISSCAGVFDTISILSFPWEGHSGDADERNRSFAFWRELNKEWRDICLREHYFRVY
jgi:hypothetical protein